MFCFSITLWLKILPDIIKAQRKLYCRVTYMEDHQQSMLSSMNETFQNCMYYYFSFLEQKHTIAWLHTCLKVTKKKKREMGNESTSWPCHLPLDLPHLFRCHGSLTEQMIQWLCLAYKRTLILKGSISTFMVSQSLVGTTMGLEVKAEEMEYGIICKRHKH